MSAPLEILRERFGHEDFRGLQEPVIARLLGGGHALVIAPTGSGKSLCYQVPALALPGLTVVISPLIALMKDQVDALRARGIDAVFINSSLSAEERERRYAGLGEGRYRLLYVTPERFRKPAFRKALERRDVALLAVDEAHCISEWGHDFRPDYSRLEELRRLLGAPTTIALTATATPEVQADIRRQLGFSAQAMPLFHASIARPNLTLEAEEVWGEDGKLDGILAVSGGWPGAGIVYFTLIKTLELFSDALRSRGVEHRMYHGKLEAGERRRVQEAFMAEAGPLVLATNAFGLGIDKPDIRFVVHAELPGSLEAYVQEIGRAGRDGAPALARLLYQQEDLLTQMRFLEWSHPKPEDYARLLAILEEEGEKAAAFGFEWLQGRFHPRGRHDHTLETALGMLERYGAIAGEVEPWSLRVTGGLPAELADEAALAAGLRRGQERLYELVAYARHEGDRAAFIQRYFGLMP